MHRKHWIIDFGVVNEAGEFIATQFHIGDQVSWTRDGERKTGKILDIAYSKDRWEWIYKIDAIIGDGSIPDFYDWEVADNLRHADNPMID